jgi:Tol biopolymer transport system component/imidazolonepropionase-like amidohydrolase
MAADRHIAFDTDEGTWLSLDLSPDGRTIVFDLLGDLYVVDASGGRAQRLTDGPAFDSQPVFAPDGRSIAYLSDASGAEAIWIANADGSGARRVSPDDGDPILVSPEWSADGRTIFVSSYRADLNAFELWKFDVATQHGEPVIPIRASADEPRDNWLNTLGARPSADGRYLYYASHTGEFDNDHLPEWRIRRRDLATGRDETIVAAPRSPRTDMIIGTAMRPVVAPDGRTLVYATRVRGRTGLRVLDLETREDRWLAYPTQQDESMASGWRDLVPRADFSADSRSLYLNDDGHIVRIDLATGAKTTLSFTAHVDMTLPPLARTSIHEETGPVRARLIQAPKQSPDGRRLAFSALAHVYVMSLGRSAVPTRLTRTESPEFQPSWSHDGERVTYVTWTASTGGHVWIARANGRGEPQRVTRTAAYYTSPVFMPDGNAVLVLRSSNSVRMHSYMEYGALRDAELVRVPLDGSPERVLASGWMGGKPHFGSARGVAYLPMMDGLNAVRLDGSGRKALVHVVGPGWYFSEAPLPADDLRLSPDGRWLLAQTGQQLYLVAMPAAGEGVETIDLGAATPGHRRITDVGADFFEWSRDGREITWAVGSTFYRRPLSDVSFDPAAKPASAGSAGPAVESFVAKVEVPRDIPSGALLLRGATVLTMDADRVIDDADLLVVDGRIAAVGARGTVDVPARATIRDVAGRFIVPGFIDTHNHIADIRRGVLDLQSWGPAADLAYGTTTVFDPSSLSIDMFAYEDLIDAGLMTGSRIHTTGPALFSFNRFESREHVRAVLSRYRDHYRTLNLKQYRSGNRRVRQWIADAARELGMMPTCEGALSMKQNLTQVIDGYSGFEHALTAVPLRRDVVELVARSGTSYTTTLSITNGGPEGQDYFIVRDHPRDDVKLNRFFPQFVVDVKMQSRIWRELSEYLFPAVAAGAASVQRAGGLVGMGAHGETPGLGLHWEMQAHAMGGMRPLEILRAVTIDAARTIGRADELGSVSPGKFADLVILERDPRLDISNTLSIEAVMKNGRLYDDETLDEIWPTPRPLPAPWFWSDRAPPLPAVTDAHPTLQH